MGEKKQEIHVLVSANDRRRLELIRDVYGISLSAAFRAAVRAISEKLGIERQIDEHIRKE